MFDQVVGNLRGMREAMRCAIGRSAGVLDAQAVESWTDRIDTAIADLLEVERRARYAEVLAVGVALVDVAIEGPPGRRESAGSAGAEYGGPDQSPAEPCHIPPAYPSDRWTQEE
jgi:hypothetical protein